MLRSHAGFGTDWALLCRSTPALRLSGCMHEADLYLTHGSLAVRCPQILGGQVSYASVELESKDLFKKSAPPKSSCLFAYLFWRCGLHHRA